LKGQIMGTGTKASILESGWQVQTGEEKGVFLEGGGPDEQRNLSAKISGRRHKEETGDWDKRVAVPVREKNQLKT